MPNIWHIGCAVPDLTEGTRELSRLFGLEWRPVVTRPLSLRDATGAVAEVEVRVTFSLGGPFAIEAWQAIEGTPLATPASGWIHHLGYWVEDLPAETVRLAELGYEAFATSAPTLSLNRGPGGIGLEPCGLDRDQPYLRDLFPDHSPFAGAPVFDGIADRAETPEVGMPEVGMPEVGMPEVGMPEVGMTEVGMTEAGAAR